jgi:hypothetical protein
MKSEPLNSEEMSEPYKVHDDNHHHHHHHNGKSIFFKETQFNC